MTDTAVLEAKGLKSNGSHDRSINKRVYAECIDFYGDAMPGVPFTFNGNRCMGYLAAFQ